MKRLLFIGTYSGRGSKGIYAAQADAETGDLTVLNESILPPSFHNATWIALRGPWLYASADTDAATPRPGVLASFRRANQHGPFRLAGTLPCGIGSPCHVHVFDKGRRLAVSQYKTGELYVFRLAPDGAPVAMEAAFRTEGKGPMRDRQDGPHIHSAIDSPDGRELFAADLGLDRVFRYAVRPDRLEALPPLACPPGSGPRHMAFSADGVHLWVIGELDSTITGFRRERNEFRQIGHWPLLPADFKGTNWAAEIRLHPNGRWLYASNRGLDDVTVMAVQPDGSLRITGRAGTGPWPRGMILSPDGRFLYAASQEGDRLDWFAIDPQTGLLEKRGGLPGIPAPVGFAFNGEIA